MSSLKHKTISGVAWSSIERFSVQGVQFIIQVIMARLLLPSDYGIVAMLAVFLAIFQTFIDSGFSAALVQKNDRSEVDYSTVFYFNIVVSLVVFCIFFFSAPLIANFYEKPVLISVTKVVALNLIISAFSVVPRAKLTALIDFKTQAKASLIAVIISGATGIWMAYSGYGFWALVWQSLLNNGINTLLLWILSKWLPLRIFSIKSFKRLFSFGSKLLFSALLDTVFRNLYLLVIGKKFSTQELGYYSRADQFAQFPSANISSIIGRVIFPVLSNIQNDDNQLVNVFHKFLRTSVYIVFPLMIGLAALSEPFIRFVLTEKWMPAVMLLQILCFSYILYPIHVINLMVLQAKGRSDLFLRLEIIKKGTGLLVLAATIPFGLIMICAGIIIHSIFCVYINAFYTKKILDLGISKQLKDIYPSFLLSLSMGGLVFIFTKIGLPDLVTLILGFLVGIVYFVSVSCLFRMQEWKELKTVVIQYSNKLFLKNRRK